MYNIFFNNNCYSSFGEEFSELLNMKYDYVYKNMLNRNIYIVIHKKTKLIYDSYFSDYEWFMNQNNIQEYYDHFFKENNHYNINGAHDFFKVGISNISDDYLMYLKLQNLEFLNNLNIVEV